MEDGLDRTVSWKTFREKLRKWGQSRRTHMPECDPDVEGGKFPEGWEDVMGDDNSDEDGEDGEDSSGSDGCGAGLELPSDFSAEERGEYELEKLADCELQIRVGMAFDQLDAVRLAVQHRAAHLDHKMKAVKGAKAKAAAQEEIKKADQCARVLSARYNDNYDRIELLRRLPKLVKGDNEPGDAMEYAFDKKTEVTTSTTTDVSGAGIEDVHGAIAVETHEAHAPEKRVVEGPGYRLRWIDLDKDLRISSIATPRTLGDKNVTGSWI